MCASHSDSVCVNTECTHEHTHTRYTCKIYILCPQTCERMCACVCVIFVVRNNAICYDCTLIYYQMILKLTVVKANECKQTDRKIMIVIIFLFSQHTKPSTYIIHICWCMFVVRRKIFEWMLPFLVTSNYGNNLDSVHFMLCDIITNENPCTMLPNINMHVFLYKYTHYTHLCHTHTRSEILIELRETHLG